MFKLLVLYAHLLATCTALGAILATDLRLLGRLADYKVRIAPPNAFITRLIGLSLLVLYASGATLVWLGLQERPDFLLNPKLQAKLVLVALLTLNAAALHRFTFRRLSVARSLAPWSLDGMGVAVPVALSNCLWLYCAFLGIARPWSYSMPFMTVLQIGAALFAFSFLCVMLLLVIASRSSPQHEPEWFETVLRAA